MGLTPVARMVYGTSWPSKGGLPMQAAGSATLRSQSPSGHCVSPASGYRDSCLGTACCREVERTEQAGVHQVGEVARAAYFLVPLAFDT